MRSLVLLQSGPLPSAARGVFLLFGALGRKLAGLLRFDGREAGVALGLKPGPFLRAFEAFVICFDLREAAAAVVLAIHAHLAASTGSFGIVLAIVVEDGLEGVVRADFAQLLADDLGVLI